MKRYKKMLFTEQLNSEKWHELLKVEEEKTSLAMSHIVTLEEVILECFMPNCRAVKSAEASASFKIIEEED